MSQRDIIAKLTDQELRKQVMISQFLLVAIAIFLSLFLFDSFTDWMHYFKWDPEEIVYFGMLPGILIVLIDILLFITLPHAAFNDGGINERLFKKQSVGFIFLLSFFVACSEELLFRGVIQTSFGYIIASILFALVHIRYLKKPVLFISVLLVSFYIGYLFEQTGNLIVTITAHFIVDFLLGLTIRFYKGGMNQ